jgi:TonB-linked SusC/RagA family outer membrane protein
MAEISVKGTVLDETGNPMPGVSVLVQGTTSGTVTNLEGEYELSNVPEDGTLVFSFLGYVRQEVPVNGNSNVDVNMELDTQSLEEVVVVGYGTQKKVNVTGAVAAVDGEVLNRRPVVNSASMLQGRLPGVRVVQNSGQPGNEGIGIQIRGQGTFSGAGSNFLLLIDGVEGNLSDINPNDIENVSVLKDAASASIYGSRAANGVILITTKSGSQGAPQLDYHGNYGVHTPTRMPEFITNSAEYMELWNEAKSNSNITSGLYTQEHIDLYRNATDRDLYPNTDWLDIIFNPAPTHTHHLFGGAAGIAEMLLQSHGEQEVIRMLPALPSSEEWQEGRVKGMRARGAFVLDYEWFGGKVQNGQIRSLKGVSCHLLLGPGMKVSDCKGNELAENTSSEKQVVLFNTRPGETYYISKVDS